MDDRAGQSSRRRAGNFRVTGNVFIHVNTKHGTVGHSATCRTSVIACRCFTPSSSTMHAGFWKKSGSTDSATTWWRVMAAGWSIRFGNCAPSAMARVLNLTLSENAGTANAQLMIGSMKLTRGRTIRSAHLIFLYAGNYKNYATVMVSVYDSLPEAEC